MQGKVKLIAAAVAFGALIGAQNARAVDHPDLFKAWSPDFKDNGLLTSDNGSEGTSPRGPWTCGGKNIAPAIAWSGAPADTKSFAILMDDPDAAMGRGGNHWIIYDIPASAKGVKRGENDPSKFVGGDSGRDKLAYHGPCNEPGAKAHHFYFMVYALDIPPGVLPKGLTKAEFIEKIKGHNTAEAGISAVYQRDAKGAGVKKVK